MSRAREAAQQLAATYYGFDGFPESMFVFFFFGPFSEARLTGSFSEVLFGSAFSCTSSSSIHQFITTIVIMIMIMILYLTARSPKKLFTLQ